MLVKGRDDVNFVVQEGEYNNVLREDETNVAFEDGNEWCCTKNPQWAKKIP